MGTSLNGLTPAGTYPGLIKTGDNAPIDGTLKTLSDGNGNNLPMAVSTTTINLTGTAQVGGVAIANTTQVAAKQDLLVSGTNIKTVNSTSLLGSGNVAVQETLVSGTNIKTINSTSLLGSGDITISANPSGVAGAIQFSNGSAFASDAANLFWDDTNNRLGVGTNAPSNVLHLNVTNTNGMRQTTTDGFLQSFYQNFYGTGVFMYNVNSFSFPSNDLAIGNSVSLGARLSVKGSGSTSATTSLLVQNSAGNTAMEVKDNLTVGMGGAYVGSPSGFGTAVASITALYPCFLMNSTGGGGSKIGLNIDTAKLYFSEETSGTVYGHRIMADTRIGGLVVLNNTAVAATASLNSSAVLQADSTTRGFLPPRMTTTQKNAIATPAAGLVVYDTTLGKLCVRTASAWETITSS